MAKTTKKLKKSEVPVDENEVKILDDVIVYYGSNKTIGRKLLKGTLGVSFVADSDAGDFIVKYRESLYLAKSSTRKCFRIPQTESEQ